VRDDVQRDLSKSAAAFKNVVWPAIGPRMGGGEIIPVESVTTSGFARDLDIKAGVDAWVTYGSTHMRGIASRVQWVRTRPFKTFTVRMSRKSGTSTEYEKQRHRIATPGAVYPYFTVQAYLRDGTNDLLIAAAAKTEDVIAAVGQIGWLQENSQDGATFWCVPWKSLYREFKAEMWWAPHSESGRAA
jgi:hypothetical protein